MSAIASPESQILFRLRSVISMGLAERLNKRWKAAEQYLSYFSNTALYETQKEIVEEKLVPPPTVIHYDPLLREIRVDTPKGFFSKVEFTPWETKHYDENDTVKDSTYYKKFIYNYP